LDSETTTLLLLHGAYAYHRSWSDFIKSAQAEGYAVFTLDLRGPLLDSYPAATVRQLDEQTQGPHELLLLPGPEHGTKMFNANLNLAAQILNWLGEVALLQTHFRKRPGGRSERKGKIA
jgi:hypothetical protein